MSPGRCSILIELIIRTRHTLIVFRDELTYPIKEDPLLTVERERNSKRQCHNRFCEGPGEERTRRITAYLDSETFRTYTCSSILVAAAIYAYRALVRYG
jgi:hypothetical protein